MTDKLELVRDEMWARKLNEYIVSVRDKDYSLGTWDCCIFAGGAIQAMTNTDPMEEFRHKYQDEESYREVLKTLGEGDLYRTLRAKFGEPVPATQAKRGDLAFHDGVCGIITGRTAMFLYQEGFGQLPITQVWRAFRVGKA